MFDHFRSVFREDFKGGFSALPGTMLLTAMLVGIILSLVLGTNRLERVHSILDSLAAAFIFAGLLYLFRDRLLGYVASRQKALIYHFRDLEEALEKLSEAVSRYSGKNAERAHITIAAPFAITPEYIDYFYPGDDQESKNKRRACRRYLAKFDETYHTIVEQGSGGSYDRTLHGRTDVQKLDCATLRRLGESHSLDAHSAPATCELGFHENLNEFATFLFGVNDGTSNPARLKEHSFLMKLHFVDGFRSFYGFITWDNGVVSGNAHAIDKKIDEATKRGSYIVSNAPHENCSDDKWQEYKNRQRAFFQSGVYRRLTENLQGYSTQGALLLRRTITKRVPVDSNGMPEAGDLQLVAAELQVDADELEDGLESLTM